VRKGHALRTQIGILVAFVALVVGGSAQAIIGGAPDSHSYVGAYFQSHGTLGSELCTGFMIGPTSFVTAAHCYDPSAGAIHVSFDTTVTPASPGPTATFDTSLDDVAIFTLSESQQSWAQLPSVGASLGVTAIDIVGYGVEGLTPQKTPTAVGTRQIVTTPVKSAGNQADVSLKLLSSPGACFGDSGGPNFASGTNTIVAITSGGSKNCNGVSYAERIDTPAMLSPLFLGGYAGK
jgi:Trypsin